MEYVNCVEKHKQTQIKKILSSDTKNMDSPWSDEIGPPQNDDLVRPRKRRMTTSESFINSFSSEVKQNSEITFNPLQNPRFPDNFNLQNFPNLASNNIGFEYKDVDNFYNIPKINRFQEVNVDPRAEDPSINNLIGFDQNSLLNSFNDYSEQLGNSFNNIQTPIKSNISDLNGINNGINNIYANPDFYSQNNEISGSSNYFKLENDSHGFYQNNNYSMISNAQPLGNLLHVNQVIGDNFPNSYINQAQIEPDSSTQFPNIYEGGSSPDSTFPNIVEPSSENSLNVNEFMNISQLHSVTDLKSSEFHPGRRRADTTIFNYDPMIDTNRLVSSRKHANSFCANQVMNPSNQIISAIPQARNNVFTSHQEIIYTPRKRRFNTISNSVNEVNLIQPAPNDSRNDSFSTSNHSVSCDYEMAPGAGFGNIDGIDGDKMIMIYTAKVAQKSYGTEKRFLCPPPVVLFFGDHQSFIPGSSDSNSDNKESVKKIYQDEMPKVSVSISGMETNGNESTFCDTIYSTEATLLSDHSSSAISGSLSGCLNTPSARQNSQLEWIVSSNVDLKEKYNINYTGPVSGNSDYSVGLLRGRCVAKNLYINDSDDKNKKVHVKVKLVDNHTNASLAEFFSKPIKVISKPSKKRQSVRNIDLCIHHGSVISLFNRLRSQTVSTKYLGVNKSMSSGGSVPKWCFNPLEQKQSNNKNNDETAPCFTSRSSVWDLFIIWLVDINSKSTEPTNPSSPQVTIPGYPVPPQIAQHPRLPPNFSYTTSDQSSPNNLGKLPEEGCGTVDQGVRTVKTTPMPIHYNQPVVLQCLSSGMVSPVMFLRKVDRGSVATGSYPFKDSMKNIHGDPVSQLHKVAFELHDQFQHYSGSNNNLYKDFFNNGYIPNLNQTGCPSSGVVSPGRYLSCMGDLVGLQISVNGKSPLPEAKNSMNMDTFKDQNGFNYVSGDFGYSQTSQRGYLNMPQNTQSIGSAFPQIQNVHHQANSGNPQFQFVNSSNDQSNPSSKRKVPESGSSNHMTEFYSPNSTRKRTNSNIESSRTPQNSIKSGISDKIISQMTWTENVGDSSVWTIVGTECATYRFDYLSSQYKSVNSKGESSSTNFNLPVDKGSISTQNHVLDVVNSNFQSSNIEFPGGESGTAGARGSFQNIFDSISQNNNIVSLDSFIDDSKGFNIMNPNDPSTSFNSMNYFNDNSIKINDQNQSHFHVSPNDSTVYNSPNKSGLVYGNSTITQNDSNETFNVINQVSSPSFIQNNQTFQNGSDRLNFGGMVSEFPAVDGAGNFQNFNNMELGYKMPKFSLDGSGSSARPILHKIEYQRNESVLSEEQRNRGLSITTRFNKFGLFENGQSLEPHSAPSTEISSSNALGINSLPHSSDKTFLENTDRSTLILHGENFTSGTKVLFDSVYSLKVNFISSNIIVCTGPLLSDFSAIGSSSDANKSNIDDGVSSGKNEDEKLNSSPKVHTAPFECSLSFFNEVGLTETGLRVLVCN
ncbi:Suppressor of hairless-like protein [Smittium mucronatum]|uniref:Suppressor of hairless-like protein n=1 Tax=Smittium mucronatum TaxID=133383 RepID=A0A1R0H252_9FUNG|nr:Suppressor of hairless-like protein [Smittium mucronatum]